MPAHIDSVENEPEPPDKECSYPDMRYERARVGTLALLAYQALPAGVRPLKLATEGHFRTNEGWLLCFDCGIHYGLGHDKKCMADLCSVPFPLTTEKMREESDGLEAVTQAAGRGLLRLGSTLRIGGPANPAAIQPSCGEMDLSEVNSVNSVRRERTPNIVEGAGFKIVKRHSVQCRECGVVIKLEMLTPLRDNSSLDYILQKHAEASPMCSTRTLRR